MNETWFEKTEQYLSGGMDVEEKSLFESEMRMNDELSSFVNLYQQIEADMRTGEKNSEAEKALRDSLGKLNAIYFSEGIKNDLNTVPDKEHSIVKQLSKEHRIKSWKTIAIAAVTIGIIIIGVLWYVQGRKENQQVATSVKKADTSMAVIKPDTIQHRNNIAAATAAQNTKDVDSAKKLVRKTDEELFADNFKPDAVPGDIEGPLEDAFTYYQQHRYKDAATEFTSADINEATRGFEADPKQTAFYACYYAGLSYLAANHAAAAIAELKKASDQSPGDLSQIKTQWYLALAYLKSGDTQAAKKLLSNVSSAHKNAGYQLQAQKLLHAMNQ
jgi:tetratricopeptide (TPR) repeat protein